VKRETSARQKMINELLLVGLVGVAAISDLASRRIPNFLIVTGLIAALGAQTLLPDGSGWMTWLLGALTGFVLFLPLYALRGMGAGDVKLMAAVGAFVGASVTVKIALATFVIGGVWALAVILFKGKWRDAWLNMRTLLQPVLMRAAKIPAETVGMPMASVGRLPYGVAIALGTLTVVFWGRW
jgi:prepilin peptidase CpaA